MAVVNSNESSVTRMLAYNKNSDRVLEVDSKVLLMVPGLVGALDASLEGGYDVVNKLSRVNYKIRREGSQCD